MIFSKFDNKFYIFVLSAILILFCSIFILSFFHIINMWSFSQSHLNYSQGFVRRGLFGSVMLGLDTSFHIPTKYFFSLFFCIVNIFNIVFFFKLIKKFIHNKIIFLFIALNPALLLFSFYDLGGYSRFDTISISLIILHSTFAYKIYDNKLTLIQYQNYLYFLLFPLITISFLIHEMQLFTLIFHFIITINIYNFNKIKNKMWVFFFILTIFYFLILFFFGSLDQESMSRMLQDLYGKELWTEPLLQFQSNSLKEIKNSYEYVFTYNALSPYNLRLHLFFYIIAVIPLILFFLFLKKNNYYLNNNLEIKQILIFTMPLLAGWVIGDLGRWINITSFCIICFAAQIPLKKKIKSIKFIKQPYQIITVNLLIIATLTIYLLFIRIPHCCDLEKKNIGIWGGFFNKIITIVRVVSDTKGDLRKIKLSNYSYLNR